LGRARRVELSDRRVAGTRRCLEGPQQRQNIFAKPFYGLGQTSRRSRTMLGPQQQRQIARRRLEQ